MTAGENIADVAGVSTAFAAYHLSLHGKPAPVIDGFSGDQRFFLSWGQSWREKQRDDSLRKNLTSDFHSPATARVNGVVRNIDGWYSAWTIRPDQQLSLPPAERVKLW